MNVDPELAVWQRQWQMETPVPRDLRRKVARQSRFMRVMLLIEILITVLIGGGAIAWAVRSPEADVIVLAAAVFVFFAAAWTFALVSRRGNWSPASLDTAAFLDLSIRRAKSNLAATIFGTILYFTEIFFCLSWIYLYVSKRTGLELAAFLKTPPVILVAFITIVFLGCVVWYRRRTNAELAHLIEFRRELTANGELRVDT